MWSGTDEGSVFEAEPRRDGRLCLGLSSFHNLIAHHESTVLHVKVLSKQHKNIQGAHLPPSSVPPLHSIILFLNSRASQWRTQPLPSSPLYRSPSVTAMI